MKKLLALFLITLVVSCSDGGVETINSPMQPEVNALLFEVQSLEQSLTDGLIMRSATEDERLNIKNDLMLCRILSLRLNERPMDQMATTELFKVLKRMESFPFSSRDSGLFESVIHDLRIALNKYATLQGVELAGLEWSLYTFKFASKLEPFQGIKYFTSSPVWTFGRGGGNSFAKVESRNAKADAWLFSPVLNLENSNKLKLVVGHTVRNPEWNNFKMLISSDYDGADPKKSEWKEFKIKPTRNVARNQWVNLATDPIDISEYAGKRITIAFQFLANEESNSVWEILDLKIMGTGDAVTTEELNITFETPSEGNGDDQ